MVVVVGKKRECECVGVCKQNEGERDNNKQNKSGNVCM